MKARFQEIRNRKAFHNYKIEETLEAGLILKGTEVKAIREGKAQINESFVRIVRGKPALYNAHIEAYSHGNLNNHEPRRPRPLLLHKREINRLLGLLEAGGKTVVPIRLYQKHGLFKVELGVGTGKKLFDKRETMRRKTQLREMERAMKHR